MVGNLEETFNAEIKRLNIRRYEVAKELGITYPALKYKVQNPERLTLREIVKLNELGINLNLKSYL